MHVKQRNLLLFGAFCCLVGAGVLCGSGIAARCDGEAGSAWGSTLTKTQKTVGSVRFYGWKGSRTDWLPARLQPAECALHVACRGVEGLEVMEKTVRLLPVVPDRLGRGQSKEDFGGWEAERSKKNRGGSRAELETC